MEPRSSEIELARRRRVGWGVVVAIACLSCSSWTLAVPVEAQFGETAQVDRVIPSGNSIDPTADGTEIDVTDRYVQQSLRDLLQLSTGTRVVQFGAAGTPFCLRLRGAPCEQTTVLFGDVPISNPDGGPFDLSLVPIEAVGEIQVFRGGAPTWLNQGAIGGVVRLMPREYEDNTAGFRVTGGSFESWRANAFGAYAGDRVQLFATGGAAGAQNDYPFLNDNNTVFDPTDDEEQRRQNADFTEGFGQSNLVVETSDKSELRFTFLGVGRERGVPGPASSPALNTRANNTRLISAASWTQQDSGTFPYRLQLLTSYDYGRNRFRDPFAEIGIVDLQSADDRSHSVFGRIASEVDVQPWLALTTIASARYFLRVPDVVASLQGPEERSDRLTLSGSVETNFHWELGNVLLELRPSVLLTWTRAEIDGSAPDGAATEVRDVLPTYRVGAAIAPTSWLGLRGSVSSGFRLPTVTELFGNRSTIVASPDLEPEEALSYDAAITLRGRTKIVGGYASVGFFRRNTEDQILFRRNAQSQIKAENIESGRSTGVEAELRGSVTEHFELIGELTWVEAIDRERGTQIPGQPEFLAYARPVARSGEVSPRLSDVLFFFEVSHIGKSFADRANLVVISARTTVALGAGVLLFERKLGLGFRAEDLFDVGGDDFLGFPLPGRRFSGRVSYAHSW